MRLYPQLSLWYRRGHGFDSRRGLQSFEPESLLSATFGRAKEPLVSQLDSQLPSGDCFRGGAGRRQGRFLQGDPRGETRRQVARPVQLRQ